MLEDRKHSGEQETTQDVSYTLGMSKFDKYRMSAIRSSIITTNEKCDIKIQRGIGNCKRYLSETEPSMKGSKNDISNEEKHARLLSDVYTSIWQ